jgi:organic hydroperoxide reductase OsmC/OhrA
MSVHEATIRWRLEGDAFGYRDYGRDHTWEFGPLQVKASAAPEYLGTPGRVDPEAALVAAAASCHMLTLLAIASRKGWRVDAYEGAAKGYLEKDERGALAITRIELRPRIVWHGTPPTSQEIHALHEAAHEQCFIANSLRTRIDIVSDS